jgi:hypothetical protein
VCYIGKVGKHRGLRPVSRGGLEWIEHPLIARYSWLVHAFSTRRGGLSRGPAAGLNLGFTSGEPQAQVRENRKLFLQKLEAEHFLLADLRQVHSASVYQVLRDASGRLEYRHCGKEAPGQSGDAQPAGDALMTNEAGILLSVRTADCLPLLLVDPKRRAVAAVHAGWRGVLARLPEKAAGVMRRRYGSEPQKLLAVLGPCIRACCYEVGEEVVRAFEGRFPRSEKFLRKVPDSAAAHSEPRPHALLEMQPPAQDPARAPSHYLDLVAVARAQLLAAGLAPRRLAVVDFCTACRPDLFYSYRKEGSHSGRAMAVIGIRPRKPDV